MSVCKIVICKIRLRKIDWWIWEVSTDIWCQSRYLIKYWEDLVNHAKIIYCNLSYALRALISQINSSDLRDPIQVLSDFRVAGRITEATATAADKAHDSNLSEGAVFFDCERTARVWEKMENGKHKSLWRESTSHLLDKRSDWCFRSLERKSHLKTQPSSQIFSSTQNCRWLARKDNSTPARLVSKCLTSSHSQTAQLFCWYRRRMPEPFSEVGFEWCSRSSGSESEAWSKRCPERVSLIWERRSMLRDIYVTQQHRIEVWMFGFRESVHFDERRCQKLRSESDLKARISFCAVSCRKDELIRDNTSTTKRRRRSRNRTNRHLIRELICHRMLTVHYPRLR